MRQEGPAGLKLRPSGQLQHGEIMIEQDMAGAQDTIYLCNFRVSVDGEWLCLKELQDVEFSMQESMQRSPSPPLTLSGITLPSIRQNHHHPELKHENHRCQQPNDMPELCDILPPSPPPMQHVSSMCLYRAFCTLKSNTFLLRIFKFL